MTFTEKQLLEYYRIICRELINLESTYGWRYTTYSAAEAFKKLKTLQDLKSEEEEDAV